MFEDIPDELLMQLVRTKLDEHIVDIQNSSEYEQISKKLNTYYDKIRELLPKDDLMFIPNFDDCITDMLIMFEDRLYIKGYRDSQQSE